jgi:hypothetical protein
MKKERADSLKQWRATITSIVLVVGLFGSAATSVAAQKPGGRAAAARKSRIAELGSIHQLKEAFQNDAGKVRLVALVSPT